MYFVKALIFISFLVFASCSSLITNKYSATSQEKSQLAMNRKSFIKLALYSKGSDIPLAAFIKNSDFNSIKVSPLGDMLAATYDKDNHSVLTFIDTKKKTIIAMFDYEKHDYIRDYHWANNETVVISLIKRTGSLDSYDNKPSRLLAVNVKKRTNKQIYPAGALRHGVSSFINKLEDSKNEVLVEVRESVEGAKLFKFNVLTGKKKLVVNPPTPYPLSYYVNHDGTPLAAVASDSPMGKSYIYYRKNDRWHKTSKNVGYSDHLRIAYVDSNKKHIFYTEQSATSNFKTLKRLELDNNTNAIVSPQVGIDINAFTYDYFNKRIHELVYENGNLSFVALPLESKKMDRLKKSLRLSFPGEVVEVLSATQDLNTFTLYIHSSQNPGDFYLFHRKSNKASYLFSAYTWINKKNMSPKEPISYKARDGVEINAYLTLPKHKKKNLPFVLYVHGGPHGVRDTSSFDPIVQLYASRGFGVLQVNYRGSSGYGAYFQTMGYKKWGTSMQDDLTDATKWLVSKQYAHPKKICIVGGSYGGYAALMSIVREPDLYACSVPSVAVSDLHTLVYTKNDGSDNIHSKKYLEMIFELDDPEWMKKHSPARQAHLIKTPILLIHGANDVRVPINQFILMKQKLEENNKAFDWMVRDEGHGFSKEINKLDQQSRVLKFLKEHTR